MKKLFFLMSVGIVALFLLPACSNDENHVEEQPVPEQGEVTKQEPETTDSVREKYVGVTLRIIEDEVIAIDGSQTVGSLSDEDATIVNAVNAFSINLFRTMGQLALQGENVFVSPFSVQQVLAILCNGTDETTKKDILAALGYEGYTVEALNICNSRIVNNIKRDIGESELDIANALWLQDELPIYRSFLSTVQGYYDADVLPIDFHDLMAGSVINQWSSDKTKGMIPQLVSQGALPYQFLLANAVYFKAEWVSPFEKELTRTESFTNTDGIEVDVAMMHMKNVVWMRHASLVDMDMVDIPYNGDFSMLICLPHEGVDMKECLHVLNAEGWQAIVNTMCGKWVDLSMPLFSIDTNKSLQKALQRLGIKELFSDMPNLTKMSPVQFTLSDCAQLSRINVNENGTEAAAVTYSSFGTAVGDEPTTVSTPIVFQVDHPFFFAIRDGRSGAILFMGYVETL